IARGRSGSRARSTARTVYSWPRNRAAPVRACVIHGQDGDLIAKESSGPCSRMREQGFGLGELQLERLAQERSEVPLDGLGLDAWPIEPEQHVVRIADDAKPSVRRIVRIHRGQSLRLTSHRPRLATATRPSE